MLAVYPEVHLVIEGHVGTSAPPEIAQMFSEQRANIVAQWLVDEHGVCPGRIVTRGWGYDAANRARASDHPNAAAAKAGYGWAEMFLVFPHGILPPRPDYYYTALASPPPPAPRTQPGSHPIFYMHPGAAVGEDVALHLFEPRCKLPAPLHPLTAHSPCTPSYFTPLHPLHPTPPLGTGCSFSASGRETRSSSTARVPPSPRPHAPRSTCPSTRSRRTMAASLSKWSVRWDPPHAPCPTPTPAFPPPPAVGAPPRPSHPAAARAATPAWPQRGLSVGARAVAALWRGRRGRHPGPCH